MSPDAISRSNDTGVDETEITDASQLTLGDRVRFGDTHHAMGDALKDHEGDTGTVEDTNRGSDDRKMLVKFHTSKTEKVGERWTVRATRLRRIEANTTGEQQHG